MKAERLLDDLSARALDLDTLRDLTSPASPYGERVWARLRPFRPGQEQDAAARASRISEIARALSSAQIDAAREVFRNVPDASGAIAQASMGDTLGDAQLLELQRFFDACVTLDGVTGDNAFPRTAGDTVREIARTLELGRAGKFGFYLADGFDPRLSSARAALAKAQAGYDAALGRATAAVSDVLNREISGTEFIVMRADLNGPLPQGVRVVREAPTYVLCELDADEATLGALTRREEAAAEVGRQEEAVRRRLSDVVRSRAGELDAVCTSFGEADVLIAAARFVQAHTCVPAVMSASPCVRFEGGVYVPLALELAREGRKFTPIAVDLDDRAVLTGPNMGGKSVCLRTCGFIVACAAFGLPVPARSATVGLFEEIAWLGAGSESEAGGLLSSFAREVVRLRDVLARRAKPMFVLMDEFARTTTPREGAAMVIAVLLALRERAALSLAATHLSGISEAAGIRHFVVRGLRGIPSRPASGDLHAALATLAESMDYTIADVRDGEAHGSDAIALAALLGLDESLIAAAYGELRA